MTGKASHRLQLQSLATCDVANTTSYKKSPLTKDFILGLDGIYSQYRLYILKHLKSQMLYFSELEANV